MEFFETRAVEIPAQLCEIYDSCKLRGPTMRLYIIKDLRTATSECDRSLYTSLKRVILQRKIDAYVDYAIVAAADKF